MRSASTNQFMRDILTILRQPSGVEAERRDRPTPQLEAPFVPSPGAITPMVSATGGGDTPESAVLQRLLAELDARALVRASAPYAMAQLPQPRSSGWVRAQLASLWAVSIVLVVFFILYADRERKAQTEASETAQTRSVLSLTGAISEQNKQFTDVIRSVDKLAAAVTSTSLQMAAMQVPPEAPRRDSRPQDSRPLDSNPRELQTHASKTSTRDLPVSAPTRVTPENPAEVLVGGHRHQPIADAVPMGNVVVHHDENGVVDYWLIPRDVAGATVMIRVLPLAQLNQGVFVHDMEDSKDYMVTNSGDWVAASSPGGN